MGRGLFGFMRSAWRVMRQVQRDKATGVLEFELKEIENIFMLVLLGGLVGLPSPPAVVAFELLPCLEEETRLMISRADFAQDPLGSLAGMLEIG